MKSKKTLYLILLLVIAFSIFNRGFAQDKNLVVRIARIRVDSAQLEKYKAALKEGIEAAISKEPGVLTLYAVADKTHPSNITVFEMYASSDAYKAHIETPHFKKYKNLTKDMVLSLELTDVVPLMLETKKSY